MCVVSMVMDQWRPFIPVPPGTVPGIPGIWPQPQPYTPGIQPSPSPIDTTPPQVVPEVSNEKLTRLIETFRKALEAAEEFDALTGQPDCVDPEKAKLIERVEELERRLAAAEGKGLTEGPHDEQIESD